MSIARAITQLIKTRITVAIKISALDEEKQIMIAAVRSKYQAKEADLTTRLDEAENALKALGINEMKIKELSLEYCKENNLSILKSDA